MLKQSVKNYTASMKTMANLPHHLWSMKPGRMTHHFTQLSSGTMKSLPSYIASIKLER